MREQVKMIGGINIAGPRNQQKAELLEAQEKGLRNPRIGLTKQLGARPGFLMQIDQPISEREAQLNDYESSGVEPLGESKD